MADNILDPEFGEIKVRRVTLARYVRLKISQSGQLTATLPRRVPIRLALELLNQSRDELRKIIAENKKSHTRIENGMSIGASHKLMLHESPDNSYAHSTRGQELHVTLPQGTRPEHPEADQYIRSAIRSVLKKQAKAYLTRRVTYLASMHDFLVTAIRFNNAQTRWGSCSHKGSLNLNIALMQLPHELIDYVIIHELCHTKHLNHSKNFWQEVERCLPEYKALRRELRAYRPYI